MPSLILISELMVAGLLFTLPVPATVILLLLATKPPVKRNPPVLGYQSPSNCTDVQSISIFRLDVDPKSPTSPVKVCLGRALI